MVDWNGIWEQVGSVGVSVTDHMKSTATTALFVLITVILLIIILKIFLNWIRAGGRRESLNHEQKEWLRIGGYNVKRKKLKNLFGSLGGKKLTDLGKIISFIDLENKHIDENGGEVTEKWSLIAVSSGSTKFYYLPQNIIENRIGDLVIAEWNFVLDKSGRYYVKNTNEVIQSSGDEDSELKTLQALSKYTLDAIKSNPIHKTRLRERNLANVSQESNWQMIGGGK